jgi:uncharacterized protein (TIGR03437 family)
VVATITPGATLGVRIYGVANAAGFGVSNAPGGNMSGRVDAGEVISIYGTGLGPAMSAGPTLDGSGRVSATLGGVRVLFDDLPAPLLYVSDTQINAVAPFGLSGKASVDMRLIFGGSDSRFRVTVAEVTPQIFKSGSTAAALNEDGSINSRENPAKAGSIVAMWATGFDQLRLYPRPADGEITTTTAALYPYAEVFIDGKADYDVLYAGPAPGMVAGMTQINLRLPSPLQFPTVIITIRRANGLGLTSEGASLWVSP